MKIRGRSLGIPQFRVRTLLIGVALLAFLFAWGRMGQRWFRCRHRAIVAAAWKESYRETGDLFNKQANTFAALARRKGLGTLELENFHRQENFYRGMADGYRALSDWSGRMQAKYEKAKTRPWRSIPPDPPAPTSASRPMIRGFGWD